MTDPTDLEEELLKDFEQRETIGPVQVRKYYDSGKEKKVLKRLEDKNLIENVAPGKFKILTENLPWNEDTSLEDFKDDRPII